MSEEVIYCIDSQFLRQNLREGGAAEPEFTWLGYRELGWLFQKLRSAESSLDKFMARSCCEKHPEWRQPIPYMMVLSMGKVLSYRRSSLVGEQRLAKKRSIGFGGHVNVGDGGCAPMNILAAADRELDEELHLPPGRPYLAFHGLLMSDFDATAQDHLGVVFSVKTAGAGVKNPEYVEEEWLTLEAARAKIDEFEHWSQVLIRDVLPELLVPVPKPVETLGEYRPLDAPTELRYSAARDVAYLGNSMVKRMMRAGSHSVSWAGLVSRLRGSRTREEFDVELSKVTLAIGAALYECQQNPNASPLPALQQFGWETFSEEAKTVLLAVCGTLMLSTTLSGVRDAAYGTENFELSVLRLYHYLHCDVAKADGPKEAMVQFRKAMEVALVEGLRRDDLEEAVRRIAFDS